MKSISEDMGLTLSYDTEIYLVGTEQLILTHYPYLKDFFGFNLSKIKGFMG